MDLQSDTNRATAAALSAGERKSEQRFLKIAVLSILVLKLALALLIVPHFKDEIKPLYSIGHVDNYATIAKSIENGDGYRFRPDTALTLMREPGYPYFLAAVRHLFPDYQKIAIALNVLFTSVCAILIYRLAGWLTSIRWVSVIAPILFMLHPGVIVEELRTGVEVPFTLLMLVFLLILRGALDTRSTGDYIKAGIALGVVSYVRSTALLFPTFLILYGLIFKREWSAVLRSAANAALIVACALLVLSPWIVRNYSLVGKFVPTASVQGVAMQAGSYICTHEGGTRTFAELDDDAAKARNEIAAQQGYHIKADYYQLFDDPRDEVKFNNSLAAQVIDQYRRSPSLFVKCAAENAFNFWFRGKNLRATIAIMCIQLPYIVLAVAGVFVGFRQMDKRTLSLLLLFVLYTVAVYVPIHAQARYSIPLVPILAMLAAVPISKILNHRLAGAGNTRAVHVL